MILSWLQDDGTRGFSITQLKEKQLSSMFQPYALVVFRAKGTRAKGTLALKTTKASGRNVSEGCFPLSWSIENPEFHLLKCLKIRVLGIVGVYVMSIVIDLPRVTVMKEPDNMTSKTKKISKEIRRM